jgi:hypothetical protein
MATSTPTSIGETHAGVEVDGSATCSNSVTEGR